MAMPDASTPALFDAISNFISNNGFAMVVAVYFLLNFPKQVEKICETIKELETEIRGLRSDMREIQNLLRYEDRLRDYRRERDHGKGYDG